MPRSRKPRTRRPPPPGAAALRRLITGNGRFVMHQLAETSGRRALAKRRATLIGAVYELSTGHVRYLDV